MIMKEIKIETEFIKLDSFLKWAGAVGSGSDAKMVIQDGMVLVNNEVCTMRGKKIRKNDCVEFDGEIYKVI